MADHFFARANPEQKDVSTVPDFKPSNIVKRLPENYFSGIDDAVSEYVRQGVDVINLANGNPDRPTPEPIVEALGEAARKKENQGYSPFYGKSSAREAVARFYAREYGVELDPDSEVAVFHGSAIGVVGIPQALLNPGDVLLTTDPCYPQYRSAAELAGARFHAIPVREEDGFLPDFRTVPEEVANRVKLLMLNYPNNPTGATATREFFADSLVFAAKHGFPVLNDFAYGALGFDGRRPISLLQLPDAKEYAVETYTLSKTYNMAGWRFGFAVGNASVIGALKHYHTHAYSTVFGAVQDAAAAALLGPQEPVRELARLYEARRDRLVREMKAIGWDVAAPQGTFFAWLRIPDSFEDSESFARLLLERAHVAVAPGRGFGEQGARYVRVNLLNGEERIREAAARLARTGLFAKTGGHGA
ncbi:aminotransferase class I/II-fold pyridoxal phosphate-dependent enzyme [Cohnella thailandensis]|uniref:Aminotransferase class I/II-fold pyridoxal phosphate-dependent enzyme n=1 Tax=Cohnella thailandensis TaxID=557557 RepID=A0A841T7G9_9BACL|nr:aminotransferase class I/II-fold pyridoxal phosphate-dependent enzyme [Cohnella thailandensis]